jgi:hypothetical protein
MPGRGGADPSRRRGLYGGERVGGVIWQEQFASRWREGASTKRATGG